MNDEDLSREELLAELAALRQRVADLEIKDARTGRWVELVQGANALKENLLSQDSLERKLKRITDGLVEVFKLRPGANEGRAPLMLEVGDDTRERFQG